MARKNMKTTLTEEELNVIQVHEESTAKDNLHLTIEKMKVDKLNLQYQLEHLKLSNSVSLMQKNINDKIKTHKEFMKEIANKRKIKGKWSFDPITGDIITEEKE